MPKLLSLALAAFAFGSLGAVARAEGEPGKEDKQKPAKKKGKKRGADKHGGADEKKGADKGGGPEGGASDGKSEKT